MHSAPVSPDTTRFATPETDAETVVYSPHKDEGQVLLDTKRAFVTYPRGAWRILLATAHRAFAFSPHR